MSEQPSRRSVLKKIGTVSAAVGTNQGLASAQKSGNSPVRVDELSGHEKRKSFQKIRRKSDFKKLRKHFVTQEFHPDWDQAKVAHVTEENGEERTAALIPLSRSNRRSRGRANRGAVDSPFIVYSGFDELTPTDLKGTPIHSQNSAEIDKKELPKAFSGHKIEKKQNGEISAQDKDGSSLVETLVTVEEGQVRTESSSSSALVSLLSERENNESPSAQGCDTCYGQYTSCTSWNGACVFFVATLYAASLGACYTCYQTGGFAEAAGVCTACVSGLVGNTVGTWHDFTCDVGHQCSTERGCVPNSQGHLCTCCSSSTDCYCG